MFTEKAECVTTIVTNLSGMLGQRMLQEHSKDLVKDVQCNRITPGKTHDVDRMLTEKITNNAIT